MNASQLDPGSAPAPAAAFERDPRRVRGSNQSGLRQFNERIVLQAVRAHGATPKAELARLTQLSSQTVSIIVNRLLADGLLQKQDRIRGKIGQPSVPLALNSEGAFSLGLQVGRRSLEALVSDFTGQPRQQLQFHYPFPDPAVVLGHIRQALAQMQALMGERWERVVGVGLTAPLFMHQWSGLLGTDAQAALLRWEQVDLATQVQTLTTLPVAFAKDTTSACMAEMLQGQGRTLDNFLYVFVGTFVGGGLVLAGHIMPGPMGNAGAIGSVPMALSGRQGGGEASSTTKPDQLLQLASGWQLEQALHAAGVDRLKVHDDSVMDTAHAAITGPWLDQASRALAMTVISATAILDIDAVVIDGSLSRALVKALIDATRRQLSGYNLEGLTAPRVVAGQAGAHARAIGASLLPLHNQFFPLKEIFLKQDLV